MLRFFAFLGLCFSLNLSAQVNLNSSLTACYALNGNTQEPINNFIGVINGVYACPNRFNNPASAMYFPGTYNEHIELPDVPLLKPTNGISFSVWVRSDSLPMATSYMAYTKNSVNTDFEAYALITFPSGNGHKFRAVKGNSGQITNVDSNTPVVLNTWYHVVFTMDNNSLKIYVNGQLENTSLTSLSFDYQATKKIYLGSSNELFYLCPFKGAMDNVRFYNRILNASEVSQLYTLDPECINSAAVPVALFSSSHNPVCVGDSVQFTDLSSNNPNAWTWTINGPVLSSSSLQNPVIHFNTAGTYTASLVSSNTIGSSNTATQIVVVHPNPSIGITASNTIVCIGMPLVLTASGASSYSWSNSQTQATITFYPFSSSSFTVTGTSSFGCQGQSMVLVEVYDCTSIDELKNSEVLTVFPNPSSGELRVVFPCVVQGELKLFNGLGQKVMVVAVNQVKFVELSLENISSGVYSLKFESSNLKYQRKLIKH